MIAFGWVTNLFQRGTASLGRLNQILSAEPEIADRPELLSPKGSAAERSRRRGFTAWWRSKIRNLSFSYEER